LSVTAVERRSASSSRGESVGAGVAVTAVVVVVVVAVAAGVGVADAVDPVTPHTTATASAACRKLAGPVRARPALDKLACGICVSPKRENGLLLQQRMFALTRLVTQ
jgi:hypothetical protein